MPWYYAANGQQTGPFTDEQFQNLVTTGEIKGDTLVWRDGMANWQPYSSVGASAAATTATAPAGGTATLGAQATAAGVICAECRQTFPVEQTVRFGDAFVCASCKPVYVQKLREGAVTTPMPGTLRYAGFWIRVAAKLIDSVILMVVTVPLGFLVGMSGAMAAQSGGPPNFAALIAQQTAASLLGTAAGLLYTWLMVGKYGATLGKMAVGLRVVMADGMPVSYGRAFGRYWAEMLSSLTCLIGYIIAGFDAEKRALHDHVCSTRVIYK